MFETGKEVKILSFDVESIGVHGEHYAVGWVLGRIICGAPTYKELDCGGYACDPKMAGGKDADRKWVAENCPPLPATHESPHQVAHAFDHQLTVLKDTYGGFHMAADCPYPVETGFLHHIAARVYPLIDILSLMEGAGADGMKTYVRAPNELPRHDPMRDARQSLNLMTQALHKKACMEQRIRELEVKCENLSQRPTV